MHPASKIKGDIRTPALSIALGAVLDGHLNMTGGESKKVVNLVQEKK
jgi:cytoskeletal protein CcmA (bactofilin family)